MPASDEQCRIVLKRLRKRQKKSLRDVADELGVPFRSLPGVFYRLKEEDQIVVHKERPPKYTKA